MTKFAWIPSPDFSRECPVRMKIKIFVGYGYNERDSWIERFVFPLVKAFGAEVEKKGDTWHIHGVGVGGFAEPDQVIDCGNSGTGVRLIMGAMATTPITATFTPLSSVRIL